MQRGDLGEAPLSVLLTRLAADKPSGCLHVTRAAEGGLPAGPEALVHLRGGRVYAASAGAERFLVGTRLVTSFGVDPTSVNEALAAQETDLTGWRVGEILVHLGYVDATAVETISREQVLEALTEIEGWRAGSWRFRPGVRTRAMLAEPIDAGDAVAAIAARQQEWADLQAVVPGPRAIARLSAEPAASEALEVDADAWALLSGIDGVRTVADLGRLRGFSLLETARGLSVLVGAGLVEVEGDPTETTENASVASMLTALEHDAPATDAEAAGAPGDSLLRVSAALSALMGSETQGGEQRDAAAADDGVADVVDLAAAREAKAREEHRAAQLDAERHEMERMAAAETARREDERRAREERAAAEERARAEAAAAAEAQRQAALEAERAAAAAAAAEAQRRAALEQERREREAAERAAAAAAEESLLAQELDVAALLRQSEEQKLAEDRVKLEARRRQEQEAAEAAAAAAKAAEEAAAAKAAEEAAAKAAEEAAAARAAEEADAARAAEEAAAARAAEEAAAAKAAEEAAAAKAAEEAAAEEAAEEAAAAKAAEEAAAEEAAAEGGTDADTAVEDAPSRVPAFTLPEQVADRGTAAGALTELAASSSSPSSSPSSSAFTSEPSASPAAEPEPEPVAAAAAPGGGTPAFLMPGQNDTASLLRELSSLGLDDDPVPAPKPPPRPTPRPAPTTGGDKGKKKKGLFGR